MDRIERVKNAAMDSVNDALLDHVAGDPYVIAHSGDRSGRFRAKWL